MKLLASLLMSLAATTMLCLGQQSALSSPSETITITYDNAKDRTTVRLVPVQISADAGKYHSIHLSPYFSFPGRSPVTPSIVDFEVQTVVRGRLSTDLYVVFMIDGEKVFLSSNRWAVKRPVPGRVWMGERLVFRMPYETFVRITKAKTFSLKFDGLEFQVGDREKQMLSQLLIFMKPTGSSPTVRGAPGLSTSPR